MTEKNNEVENKISEKDFAIEENLKDIMKNLKKQKNEFSKEEIEAKLNEVNESIEFLKKVEEVEVAKNNKRIIFTNGQDQLLYENGEFFIVSTTDINKKHEKLSKLKAKEMFLEYFITYILNPTIKKENTMVDKNIQKIDIQKNKKQEVKVVAKKENEISKEEIKPKQKSKIEHEKEKENNSVESKKIIDIKEQLKSQKKEIQVEQELTVENFEEVENKFKYIINKKSKKSKTKVEIREQDKIK